MVFSFNKLSLFLLIFFLSCHQKDEKNTGDIKNNLLKKYYKGKLQSEFSIKNGVKEGIGKCYYLNGKLSSTCNYTNGLKDGVECKYYFDGNLYRTREFTNGELNGIEKRFYRNGKLMTILSYRNGMPAKGLKEYSMNGNILTDYPEFVYEIIHDRDYPKQKLLIFYFKDYDRTVYFYQGVLLEGKYFNTLASPCGMRDGKGEIGLDPKFRGEIIISAKFITSKRAPYVVEKKILIK